MTTTATSSFQMTTNQASQLDLEGHAVPVDTSTKRKRKKISGPRLTTRDRQLLAVLHYYGGCMETIALSDLLWTPDLARRLTGWGVTPEQAQTWLAECAHSDLYDKVEQLKWGQSLNRLRHSTRLTKADQKVVAWLDGLESDAQRELVSWLDNLEAQTAATWLAVAITQDSPAPPERASHHCPAWIMASAPTISTANSSHIAHTMAVRHPSPSLASPRRSNLGRKP